MPVPEPGISHEGGSAHEDIVFRFRFLFSLNVLEGNLVLLTNDMNYDSGAKRYHLIIFLGEVSIYIQNKNDALRNKTNI